MTNEYFLLCVLFRLLQGISVSYEMCIFFHMIYYFSFYYHLLVMNGC